MMRRSTQPDQQRAAAEVLRNSGHPPPYEFEEFVERVLWAQRHLGPHVCHVARVDRWGTLGEKQDGIDLEGEFNDGVPAAWQCKHLDKLRPFEVREAVDAMTYPNADRHYLVYSREVVPGLVEVEVAVPRSAPAVR